MSESILTFKYRVKDSTVGRYLGRHALKCNLVWNFCVATQREAERKRRAGLPTRWPSAFDLINLCAGSSAELGLHSDTIQTICRQFAASRDKYKRCPRFRASKGSKRALGWVPFISRAVKIEGDHLIYLSRKYHFWKSREVKGHIRAGAFVQDARGRWYVCLHCDVKDKLQTGTGKVGIDLGLKTLATCSDGTAIPALRHYRRYEAALAIAQRSGNKSRVRAIHAKIANARRNHLHEWSAKLARENELIVVGNISPAKLSKTRMAKSVYDASWSMLRSQLRYKASRHGARYVEADERLSSQTCSDCGAVGGPKGIAGLGVRRWTCPCCGSSHDRDVNAARNILRVGAERRPPVVEIATVTGGEGVNPFPAHHRFAGLSA